MDIQNTEVRAFRIGRERTIEIQASCYRFGIRLILQQGMLPAWIGTAAGATAAFGLTRLMTKLLYEIRPGDPATLLLAALGILIVSGIACYIPAFRAARTDVLASLRYE